MVTRELNNYSSYLPYEVSGILLNISKILYVKFQILNASLEEILIFHFVT